MKTQAQPKKKKMQPRHIDRATTDSYWARNIPTVNAKPYLVVVATNAPSYQVGLIPAQSVVYTNSNPEK